MGRQYISLAALSLALATVLTTPALATDSGFYVGANIGQSKFDTDEFVVVGLGTTVDDTDTAWSFVVGYRFTPYFGIEAGYMDMGETTSNGSVHQSLGVPNSSLDITTKSGASINGTALAVVGTIPTGNFEFSAKIGAFFANTEVFLESNVNANLPPNPPSAYITQYSNSANSTEALYGLGAGYDFQDHFHFRIDWTMVPSAGKERATGEGDVQLFTAGFQYRF